MAFKEIPAEEMGNFHKFEQHGDVLEGIYEGQSEIDGKFGKQTVSNIRPADSGDLASVSGWDVTSKLAKVEPGTLVRVTYVSDKDMGRDRSGQPKNPMKVFRVEYDDAPTAKAAPAVPAPVNGSSSSAPRTAPF